MQKNIIGLSFFVLAFIFGAASVFGQAKSELRITSNVKGALIYVDGTYKAATPATVTVANGNHLIKVTANGYADYLSSVNVTNNLALNAALQKIQRLLTLSISSNVNPATVSIDGRDLEGATPQSVGLEKGTYVIKVQKNGYTPFEARVELKQDTRIEASLLAAGDDDENFHYYSSATVAGIRAKTFRTATAYKIYFQNVLPETVSAHLKVEDRGDPYLNYELKPGEKKYIASTNYNLIGVGYYSKATGKILIDQGVDLVKADGAKTGIRAFQKWLPDFSAALPSPPRDYSFVEFLGKTSVGGERNFIVKNTTSYKVRIFGKLIAGKNDYGVDFYWTEIGPNERLTARPNIEDAFYEVRFYAETVGGGGLFWGGYDYRTGSRIPREDWVSYGWENAPGVYYPQSFMSAINSDNLTDVVLTLDSGDARSTSQR